MRTVAIKVKLNSRSINAAIRKLEQEKKRINRKLEELIQMMCNNGEEYAYQYLTHVDTGETIASIMGYRQGTHGVITVGGAAVWIEFGTGVIHNQGTDHFHDNRKELGISDWGTYGDGHGSDPNGWYYYDRNGKKRHTEGIPMEPFMQNTAERLYEEFTKTAEKVFK